MPHKTTSHSNSCEEQPEIQRLQYISEEATQRIRERCRRIRNSSNPLYDAAKIAVYINCLMDLLREQGFEYKHENSFDKYKPDKFEVTEVKSGKKVECEADPIAIRTEINEDLSENEVIQTSSIISEEEVELISRLVEFNKKKNKIYGKQVIK